MRRIHLTYVGGVILGLFILALVGGPAEVIAQQPWDRKIDKAKDRFIVLKEFNNAAVSDKETALVWERSPGETDGVNDVDSNDRLR